MREMKPADGCANIPSLGLDGLGEFTVLGRSHALEVIPDIFRKCKGLWVLLVEGVEEWRKQATSRLFRLLRRDWALCHADEAEPGLAQLTTLVLDRRVKTREVKCSVTSIAAQKEATAVT